MEEHHCLIPECKGKAYSPAGTAYLCKKHFLDFLTWRRRKGAAMFHKYAAMTMDERDDITTEWRKTVVVER